jgi:hypothetical protein
VLFCLGYPRPDSRLFRIGFALRRKIDVKSGCTTRLVPDTERDTNGRCPAPPRSLVLAAALVVVTGQRWRWRHRMATPTGALAAGATTWILIG